MPESFSFDSELKECEMPRANKKGEMFYKAKTDHGVVNIPVNAIEGQPEIGKLYMFAGTVSEYEYKGEMVKSKWAQQVTKIEASAPIEAPIPGIGEKPVQQDRYKLGMAVGQALNNAYLLSCFELSKTGLTPESVTLSVAKWYKVCRSNNDRIQAEELDSLNKGF